MNWFKWNCHTSVEEEIYIVILEGSGLDLGNIAVTSLYCHWLLSFMVTFSCLADVHRWIQSVGVGCYCGHCDHMEHGSFASPTHRLDGVSEHGATDAEQSEVDRVVGRRNHVCHLQPCTGVILDNNSTVRVKISPSRGGEITFIKTRGPQATHLGSAD